MLFSHQHVANNNIAHLWWNIHVLILRKMSMPYFCIISKLYFSSVFYASKFCFIFVSIHLQQNKQALFAETLNESSTISDNLLSVSVSCAKAHVAFR